MDLSRLVFVAATENRLYLVGGLTMDRVVHKARDHDEARAWDIAQNAAMTPEQRLRAARVLKDRAYPPDAKDVRECDPPG